MRPRRARHRPADGGSATPTVLIAGGGFAGFHCARTLERRLPRRAARIVLVSPADYLLYSPLLPNVAAGVCEPRHVAVGLHGALRRTQVVIGHVVAADRRAPHATVLQPDGSTTRIGWDRLVIAPGGVTRTFHLPGVAERAHGLKTLAEATYLRDHVLRQLDRADAATDTDRRRACCTFVVVGAGYAGTELAAQMQLLVRRALPRYPRLGPEDVRWVLVEQAGRVLPELDPRLGAAALAVLRRRGVEVRLGTGVREVTPGAVHLSDGEVIQGGTLVWCTGTTPSPLVETLGLPAERGRLVVDDYLRVPGDGNVFAIGDAAAVPDLTRPGQLTGQTTQHAERQGRAAGRNVAASLGHGRAAPYRHRDLGFAVDLGGWDAVAKPLGVPLSGLAGVLATRGYHLLALPSMAGRVRVGLDWLLEATGPPQVVQLGFLPAERATIAGAEPVTVAPVPPPWVSAAADIPATTLVATDRGLPGTPATGPIQA
jgi:NADH:ubiquinone reductase (H+-translocating)